MRRREVLASVATMLTGCAGAESRPTLTPAPVPTTRPQTTLTTSDPTDAGFCPDRYQARPISFESLPPVPDRYDGLDCPAFAGRLICRHRGEYDEAPAILVSDSHFATLVGESGDVLEFVLVNRGSNPVSFEAATWAIFGKESGSTQWNPVAIGRRGCRRVLPPDRAHRWHIGIGTEPAVRDDEIAITTARQYLPPGTYVFGLPVTLADGASVTCVAPCTVRRVLGAPGPITSTAPPEPSRTDT